MEDDRQLRSALALIAEGLGQFVLAEERRAHPLRWVAVTASILETTGERDEIERCLVSDPFAALAIMRVEWNRVYKELLGNREHAWVAELLAFEDAARNGRRLARSDVIQLLEVSELLLRAVGAPQAHRVARLRKRLERRRRAPYAIGGAVIGALAVAALVAVLRAADGENQAMDRFLRDIKRESPADTAAGASYVANVSRRTPFDSLGVSARSGDLLLLRVRIEVSSDPAEARESFVLESNVGAQGGFGTKISTTLTGPSTEFHSSSGGVRVAIPLDLRVRSLTGTTELLDAMFRRIRPLASLPERGRIHVGRLAAGSIFYVDSLFRVTPMHAKANGQFHAGFPVSCPPDPDPGPQPRAMIGDVVECELELMNSGPRTVRDGKATLSIGYEYRNVVLKVAVDAGDADPPRSLYRGSIYVLGRFHRRVNYVRQSSAILDAGGRRIRTLGDGIAATGVAIGPVPPGSTNARRLRFKIRVG